MPKKSRLHCYFGCKNDGPLHLFPNPNTESLTGLEKFNIWKGVLRASTQEKGNSYIYNSIRLCNNHFKEGYCLPSNRLTKNAVPTLCLEPQGQSTSALFIQQPTILDSDQPSAALAEPRGQSREELVTHQQTNLECQPSTSAASNTLEYVSGNVMHSFPNPDKFPERFKAWVNLVGYNLETLTDCDIYKKKRICDIHFTDEHRNRFKRLNALAMPTLYLPEGGLHVFPNPINFPEQFNAWVRVVSGQDECELDYKKLRICSRHFTKRDWNRNNRLNALAVPSLFLHGETTPSTQEEFDGCADPVPTASKASLASLSTPGTGPTIDIEQTPNSSGVDNTDICDDNDDADDDLDTLVESNVCRVCLALDVKMYELKDIELREMFQNITGIAVSENNHPILERLCWECTGRLKAAAAFRNKALLSDALLQGLASTGEQIRKNDITSIKENQDYLKSVGCMSAVEVFHVVDIDPENDSVSPISENNDTKTVQKKVRKYSIKVTKDSIIINEDNNQMDVEAPITTEVEYDQVDHICPNTEEESSNNFVDTNPVDINNVPFREDKINSANSSPPPSCSHVKPTYPIRGCLLKTTSDFEDKIKKSIIKTAKRDSISKKVSKNMVLKGDAKLKNIYVKIGGISKKKSNLKLVKMTQVKANTPTDEEVLSLEDFEF